MVMHPDAADQAGNDAVARAVREAGAALALSAADTDALVDAACREAAVRHPALAVQGAAVAGHFDFSTLLPPKPGRFDPRVVQLRLSPFISSACGAVGAALGSVPVLGWALIGVTAAIALRDFWNKKVVFDGVHGQLLFEMYRSTDSGKAHAIPADHLYANVNASRAGAKEPPLARAEFDLALNLLVSTGILGLNGPQNHLRWTEMAIEIRP